MIFHKVKVDVMKKNKVTLHPMYYFFSLFVINKTIVFTQILFHSSTIWNYMQTWLGIASLYVVKVKCLLDNGSYSSLILCKIPQLICSSSYEIIGDVDSNNIIINITKCAGCYNASALKYHLFFLEMFLWSDLKFYV